MSAQVLWRRLCAHSSHILAPRSVILRLHSSQATLQATLASLDGAVSQKGQRDVSNPVTYVPPELYKSTVKLPPMGPRKTKVKPRQLKAKNDISGQDVQGTTGAISVELHLASLHAAGMEPTMTDLERCRPPKHPHPDSSKYVEAYNALVDTLCRSFSKEQLMNFLRQYDANSSRGRSGRRKIDYAESIIEQEWGWPSLREVERAKRDRTEVSTQSFPMDPAELFLILGRDGADLLALSRKFNVHIALASNPLALRVEGVRNSLQQLERYIASLKEDIVTKTFSLPINLRIRRDLVQRVSRLAGAYIELLEHTGEVKVVGKDDRSIENAERLTIRTAYESQAASRVPYIPYIPHLPHDQSTALSIASSLANTYSLYPFLSSRPLPWVMGPSGAFRLQKVSQWLSRSDNDPNTARGLASDYSCITTTNHALVDLRQLLLEDTLRLLPASTRRVKATLGHILITTPSSDQKTTLSSPLQGYHRFSRVHKWILDNHVDTLFVPSLPQVLVTSSPSEQSILHRLVYEALPPAAQLETPLSPVPTLPSTHFLSLEVHLATSSGLLGAASSHQRSSISTPMSSRCSVGQLRKMDLMIPSRPMDIRFTVTDSIELSSADQPHTVKAYMNELLSFLAGDVKAGQPDPPLLIEHDGTRYILQEASSVRQSQESIPPESSSKTATPGEIMAESILDLETNERIARCEIVSIPSTEEVWQSFLKTCDQLSSATYKPAGSSSPLN